ncbi:MAG: 4-hydroxy-tetrahydrodipicolinate synthase [Bacteroidota bacterium]
MKRHQFRGLGVALVTPFRNGKIDFDALEKIIEYQIENGTDFLVSLGSTGEAIGLSTLECKAVLRFTVKVNAGRLPIVAGLFGHNNTAQLVNRIKSYEFEGIDAIMSSSPAYNKPNQEGIYQHYRAIAKASPRPIIIYNVPGRTASNVLPTTILRLARSSEKFIAVKEATGDLVQGCELLKHRPDDFLVLSGDDPTALPFMACGADGVISVIGNALPREFSELTHAALNGDFARARQLHLQLFHLYHWLYVDGNPAGVKAALEILHLCQRDVRLPLTPQSPENILGLRQAMEQAGVLSIPC